MRVLHLIAPLRMNVVELYLTLPGRRTPAPADLTLLADILWAHSGTDSGVEHIRAKAGAGYGAVTLVFLVSAAIPHPEKRMRQLVEMAVARSPFLTGALVSCPIEPFEGKD